MSLFNMFEEELREYGTIEEKRKYINEQRLANPNWVNTIFPPGKTKRGEGWSSPHKGMFAGFLGSGRSLPLRQLSRRNGAKPGNSRKARAH